MTFPEFIGIYEETYTIDVIPHLTQMPNGTISTVYKTLRMNESSATETELREEYTWTQNGMTLYVLWRVGSALKNTDTFRTYPTTYMWFGGEISGFLGSESSDQTLPISTTCSTGRGAGITLPLSADPSSLVAIVGTTFFGQHVSGTSTSSIPNPSLIPSSILGYLDTLPEVREQLSDIPITSCASLTPEPDECTIVMTSTSTSCLSGLGNLTNTHCTEKVITITSTVAKENGSPITSPPLMTTDPVLVPRRPAAYLTYNTLPLSDDGAEAGLDQATPDTTPTSAGTQSKETRPGHTFEKIPLITTEVDTPKDSKPTSTPGEASHTDEPQAAKAVINALVSLATASQDAAKTTESGGTAENSRGDDAGNQQPASDSVIDPPETQSIGNLLGALQAVASQAVTSPSLAATAIPQDQSNVKSPLNTGEVEPQTRDGSPEDATNAEPSATATKPSVPDTVTNSLPIFTSQGQTVTAGGTVTFGGHAVSQLPNADGVLIDHDRTVFLNGGEATILPQQGSQQAITVSRSGLAFIVNGQTIPADQEITAGQTTQAITAGSAVTFGGNAVSKLTNADGVVINHDRTVILSDGGATTLPQQDAQQPITISRSGTAFIVNGKTVPANQEITVGQTTASASTSGSSAVLHINETPVSTMSRGFPATSTGVGGYINSGMGGDVADASFDGTSADATDGSVTPSTGDGSRVGLLGWSCGTMAVGFVAFLGFGRLL